MTESSDRPPTPEPLTDEELAEIRLRLPMWGHEPNGWAARLIATIDAWKEAATYEKERAEKLQSESNADRIALAAAESRVAEERAMGAELATALTAAEARVAELEAERDYSSGFDLPEHRLDREHWAYGSGPGTLAGDNDL